MDNLIYINGTANPEQITSDDIQDMRTDTKFVVNKFRGQQDLVKDVTLPTKYTAEFVEDETAPHLYVRHYRAYITVPEYTEGEIGLVISLVKGVVTPNITVNVRFSGAPLPREEEKRVGNNREMVDGKPRFIKEQLGNKLRELFSYLTDEQVEQVVAVLAFQMRNKTAVNDKTFLAFLHRAGIAEDTDVAVFNTMITDICFAMEVMGIDILEPDATVNWNC